MSENLSRRSLLRILGAGSLAAGMGALPARPQAPNDGAPDSSFAPNIKLIEPTVPGHTPARLEGGKVIQPARELTVIHTADVLVVGGGSAGFAAAVAAARTGAKVALVERYGYFGGLWTGGLVLTMPGMNVKVEGGKLRRVSRGLCDELLTRLAKTDQCVISYAPDKDQPTADPEALKFTMDQMIMESGVEVFLHCLAADAIVEGRTVKGVIFESKSGRQAILAKIVIDATGDGDVFAAAGASYKQITHAIGEVHRLGNVDRLDASRIPAKTPFRVKNNEPVPSAQWVNMLGSKGNALDVRDLSNLEMQHRKAIWNYVQKMRKTPGYEKIFLLQTAPQLGVRASRLLNGLKQVKREDLLSGAKFPDVVGVGGSDGLKHGEWQIPYGALVSADVENMLAAGRCISTQSMMIDKVRLIPACMITGHAAGVAAAIAVKDNVRAREVDIAKLQKTLKEQGAYLG